MFNSIKAAVTRQHQLTQTLSPLGYKVTYMGAGEMVVTVAEISPQKPVASSGHASETTSTHAVNQSLRKYITAITCDRTCSHGVSLGFDFHFVLR
jgi:hypothetical protein